jgi:hypothetical protein
LKKDLCVMFRRFSALRLLEAVRFVQVLSIPGV